MAEQKYFSTKSPPGPWDYIVIGSGMGGMTSAALLAQLGKRVLVLEQHYVPGGFTHTFRRKRWRWDVGVHAIGEVTQEAMVGRFLNKVTEGALEWVSLGPVYDEFIFPGGFEIGFPDTRPKFREVLLDAFPAEGKAIDEYFLLVKEVAKSMRGHYLARTMPPWLGNVAQPILGRKASRLFSQRTVDVIAGLTQNEKLRTVLTSQWGYYGSPPSESSFAGHALVAKHFFYGGYYPKGGSQRIAETLMAPVIRAGGAVRIRADVKEILVEGNTAIGVKLANGEDILAKRVISGIGALETVNHLLPERYTEATWARRVRTLKPSPAHVCVYLGFQGDIREAGAGSANKWFYETWNHDITEWDFRKEEVVAPVLYTSFPSLKDPEHNPGPEQLHTGEIVTFLPVEAFAKWDGTRWMRRGEDYEALKGELTERLTDQLCSYMPGLKSKIVHAELSTPLSTLHFTRAAKGAIYGLEATPERFANPWLRPRTPVKNLFMAGCDVAMVGVIGAMVGGALAALAAEPRQALPYLMELQ